MFLNKQTKFKYFSACSQLYYKKKETRTLARTEMTLLK